MTEGKRKALLIANESYMDPTFRQLKTPQMDAVTLASVLADPNIGGYDAGEPLFNPTREEAALAIEGLFAESRVDDLVLLHISGHGIKDDAGRLHLVMTNSRQDRLNSTAVSAQFIREQMDASRSQSIVLFLDCCYAGAFPAGSTHRAGESTDVLAQLDGRGRVVMTSSSALEYSFEPGDAASATLTGDSTPSIFTGLLVDGLKTGKADLNWDGTIDSDELYDYVYERIKRSGVRQTPGLKKTIQGRIAIANSPGGVRPLVLRGPSIDEDHLHGLHDFLIGRGWELSRFDRDDVDEFGYPKNPECWWEYPNSFNGVLFHEFSEGADLTPQRLSCQFSFDVEAEGAKSVVVETAGNEFGCSQHEKRKHVFPIDEGGLAESLSELLNGLEVKACAMNARELIECRFFAGCGERLK